MATEAALRKTITAQELTVSNMVDPWKRLGIDWRNALFAVRHLSNQGILTSEAVTELERIGVEWDKLIDLRTGLKKVTTR